MNITRTNAMVLAGLIGIAGGAATTVGGMKLGMLPTVIPQVDEVHPAPVPVIEPQRTRTWYWENWQERDRVVAKCRERPFEAMRDGNCLAADAALMGPG